MLIRFPKTSTDRNAQPFVRLLTHVTGHRPHAMVFQGKHYKCGSTIGTDQLPRPAIALEYAGQIGPRNRRVSVHVLWRFDFADHEWREIARAQAADWTWSLALRPLAQSALYGDLAPGTDIPGLAAALLKSLDSQLRELEPAERPQLLSVIETEIAARCAEFWKD